ncbi:MAG: hypothetical protein BWY09_00449 [Candidatus Hydrogenedentes bacterium ADurb.Bin179]|nr:MAG: hypothetical protein BWY09_00449 [Candidatus Hydrogenedentes bacterium ADurb.Bin179]
MNQECQAYKTQILNYLSGNLKPEQSALVLAHLEQCSSCSKLVEDMGVMPHLAFLDESHIEESVARVREAIQAEKREKTAAGARGPTWPEKIGKPWQGLFRIRFAVPATALAATAMVLLVWFVGGFSFHSVPPDTKEQRLAQGPQQNVLLAASWLPDVRDGKHTDALFEPYSRRKNLEGFQTLGGDLVGAEGNTGAPAGFMGSLFAVMDLDAEDVLVSTAVLLDRERELLICVYPVPDRVLLRALVIETREGDLFVEQQVLLNESLSCQAHTLFRDEASGLALLYAPGIDHMLSILSISKSPAHNEMTPGLVKGHAGGFVISTSGAEESQDAIAEFFYETPLDFQATQGDDGEIILTLSGEIPENLPSGIPLFSDDGANLIGVLFKTSESGLNVVPRNRIDNMVIKAAPLLDEARVKYQSWYDELHTFVRSLGPEDFPHPLTFSSSAKGMLQFLPEEGYVLTIDTDNDDAPNLAITTDYPGLLMRIHPSDNGTGEILHRIGP